MAGYSTTSLQKKLGIKPGMSIYLKHVPPEYFDWISPLPAEVHVADKLSGTFDFIHVFVTGKDETEKQFNNCKKYLKPNGMLWISWPKKSSKIKSDVDENVIRMAGLTAGLVDVKVCAVSEVWSGLKFVFRLANR